MQARRTILVVICTGATKKNKSLLLPIIIYSNNDKFLADMFLRRQHGQ